MGGTNRTVLTNHLEHDLKQQVIQFSKNQKQNSNDTLLNAPKPKLRLSFQDIRKIRAGHDIIINNLEMDFPSLKDFALQLGTNEFKLKYGLVEYLFKPRSINSRVHFKVKSNEWRIF